ncbi:hypothetical protein AXF42_Ash005635 [Apostasia shenzhenica]|uniref:Retrotransposon gag domain-containing protein n=1 Tax=Apostasia shenzhenica TaxID=1088818 RepID=A0A2I0BBY6_9ASPA|nr:hypothetical protein AXF42_Ash005635 [Apostasia shenzhenica]
MKQELIAHFIGRICMALSDMVLANIQRGENESLRSYTDRFFSAVAETKDINLAVAIHNYRRGLISSDLSKSLQLVKPKSFPEIVARANQFVLLEDTGNDAPDISDPRVEQRVKRKYRDSGPVDPRVNYGEQA